MLIIEKYYLYNRANNVINVLSEEEPVCPSCGAKMCFVSTYKRRLRDEEYKDCVFIIRRLYCKECGVTHSELPSLFLPYKQYARDTIRDAVSGDSKSFSGENSTVQRWRKLGGI